MKTLRKSVAMLAVVCILMTAVMPVFAIAVDDTHAGDYSGMKVLAQEEAKSARTRAAKMTFLVGDLNFDNRINTGDVVRYLRCFAGLDEMTMLEKIIGDFNNDGEVSQEGIDTEPPWIIADLAELNPGDPVAILRYIAGLGGELRYLDVWVYDVVYNDGFEDFEIAVPDMVRYVEGDTVTVADALAREGYEFIGWQMNDMDSTVYNPGDTFVMPTNDITLTAIWEKLPTEQTVTYTDGVDNEEIAVPETETVMSGSEYTIPEMTPVRDGYNFMGWTAVEGLDTTAAYNPGDTFVMPDNNVVFAAVWEEDNIYTVSYADGVEGVILPVPNAEQVMAGTEYTIPSLVPNHADHQFLGWAATSGLSGDTLYQPGDTIIMPESNVLFVATWEEVVGVDVTFTYYDAFNELEVDGELSAEIFADTTFNSANIPLPNGYKLYNETYSVNVAVSNGVASPASVRVEVYPFRINEAEGNAEYMVIYTMHGLYKVRNWLSRNYVLGNDIDATMTSELIQETGDRMFWPIGWQGTTAQPFTGTFDGDGYEIFNLTMDYSATTSENVGMISVNDGTIKNLVISTREYTGDANNYGVFGWSIVGALVGLNRGDIINCHGYGNVGALDYVNDHGGGAGGLVGLNMGTVSRSSYIGGSEGYFWIGGLIGKNVGTVDQCYTATGINSVLSVDQLVYWQISYVGGIVGGNEYHDAEHPAIIRDSYMIALNYIYGYQAVGGITGFSKGGRLENCYVVTNGLLGAMQILGSFIGHQASVSTDQYGLYDLSSGTTALPGTFSSSTWDMQGVSYPNLPDLVNNRRPEGVESM